MSKYKAIYRDILGRIEQNLYAAGDTLPGEYELMKHPEIPFEKRCCCLHKTDIYRNPREEEVLFWTDSAMTFRFPVLSALKSLPIKWNRMCRQR